MPNVAFVRNEVKSLYAQYNLIRDALSGETAVKASRDTYLPIPNAADTSKENVSRYEAYLKRAVFYNATRRTLASLVGQVFMRDPKIEAPDILAGVINNATGTGINITQLSKKSLSLTLAYSRSGLFVDYPTVGDQLTTIADIERGHIRPTMYAYGPKEIVNWRTIDIGAEEVLSLVVLNEMYGSGDDGFEIKSSQQFRVLRLDEEGNYIQEIWRETDKSSKSTYKNKKPVYEMFMTIHPRDANGDPIRIIPFTFIGSENNDADPDHPNFYDLASLNMAHYRNSADYEEQVYICGQPTVVLAGVTENWMTDVLGGSIRLGAVGGIPLPSGGSATLLQTSPNMLLKEAMDTKERQMVALGARLVEKKSVERTATEVSMEAASQSSVLSSTTKNVSMAYEWALRWAASMMKVNPDLVTFELNTDYDVARMSNEERRQLIEEWQSGAITFEEMRSVLRKAGVAVIEDSIAKTTLESEINLLGKAFLTKIVEKESKKEEKPRQ